MSEHDDRGLFGNQPPGEPYPGMSPMTPQPAGPTASAPPEVERAALGLFALVALNLVNLIVSLTQREAFADVLRDRNTGLTESQIDTAVTVGIVTSVVFGLAFMALYVWLAFMLRQGRNWARVTVTVLLGLGVVFGLVGLVQPGTTLGKLIDVLTLATAVVVIVLLWRPAASAFFTTGGRRPA
jgi:hypothetical protein